MKNDKVLLDSEIKSVGEEGEGSFVGVASVTDKEDLDGDIIERNAFKKTLSEQRDFPILWQHDKNTPPIGKGSLTQQGDRLILSAKLDMKDPLAVTIYQKIKDGLLKGLSIGFQSLRHSWEQQGEKMIRRIHELKLYEVSVVNFPAVQEAQIISVKHDEQEIENIVEKVLMRLRAMNSNTLNATPETPGAGESAAASNPSVTPPAEDHGELAAAVESLRQTITGQ